MHEIVRYYRSSAGHKIASLPESCLTSDDGKYYMGHQVANALGLVPLPDGPRGHLALLLLLLLALLLGGRPEGEGPERPPGLLLLGLDVRALALHRGAVAALGVGASLLGRAVEAVAIRAVRALVTLAPGVEGKVTSGSGLSSKRLLVASKAHPLSKSAA